MAEQQPHLILFCPFSPRERILFLFARLSCRRPGRKFSRWVGLASSYFVYCPSPRSSFYSVLVVSRNPARCPPPEDEMKWTTAGQGRPGHHGTPADELHCIAEASRKTTAAWRGRVPRARPGHSARDATGRARAHW